MLITVLDRTTSLPFQSRKVECNRPWVVQNGKTVLNGYQVGTAMIGALVAFAFHTSAALAGPTSYSCTINFAANVDADGLPVEPGALTSDIGSHFVVDRSAGRMMGAVELIMPLAARLS